MCKVEPEVSKRGEGSKTVKNASPEKAKQTKAKARKVSRVALESR